MTATVILGYNPGNSNSKEVTIDRVSCGLQVHSESRYDHQDPIILTGGPTFNSPEYAGISEAGIMKGLISQLGVPNGRLVLEDRSINTEENIRNILEYLKYSGIPKVKFVTSPDHIPQVRRYVEQHASEIYPDVMLDFVPSRLPYGRQDWMERLLELDGLRKR